MANRDTSTVKQRVESDGQKSRMACLFVGQAFHQFSTACQIPASVAEYLSRKTRQGYRWLPGEQSVPPEKVEHISTFQQLIGLTMTVVL
jgi:hypothetical protein